MYALAMSMVATSETWAGFGLPTLLTKKVAAEMANGRVLGSVGLYRSTVLAKLPVTALVAIVVFGVLRGMGSEGVAWIGSVAVVSIVLIRAVIDDASTLSFSFSRRVRPGRSSGDQPSNTVLADVVFAIREAGAATPVSI